MMRDLDIISIDLSLTATGITYPMGTTEVINWGDLPKHKGKATIVMTSETQRARLAKFQSWCKRNIHPRWEKSGDGPPADLFPHVVVIESNAFSASGASVLQAAELRGYLRGYCLDLGVPLVEILPAVIKLFGTGKGNASKSEMVIASRERFGLDSTDDNEADSFIMWHLVHSYLGTVVADRRTPKLPQAHLKALDGKIHDIDWQGLRNG